MSTTRIEFQEKGLNLLWSWILDKIIHDLPEQYRFIIRSELPEYCGAVQTQTFTSVQHALDVLYHGTATDYINQFWDSDGKDIGLIGLQLFQGIKVTIESLKAVIEEHSDWEDVNAAHEECNEDRKMHEMKDEKDYSAKECKE